MKQQIVVVNTSKPLRFYMRRRPTQYALLLGRANHVINISATSWRHYFQIKTQRVPWEEKIYFRLPGNRWQVIRRLNSRLWQRFLKKWAAKLTQPPILWSFYSGNAEILTALPWKKTILEICDYTPTLHFSCQHKRQQVAQAEKQLLAQVDIVFAVSETLRHTYQPWRKDIHVVRNGVFWEDFARVPNLEKKPQDELFNLPQPIIGYVGAVSHRLDFALLEAVGKALPHGSFVFIGRIDPSQIPQVKHLRNQCPHFHFLGERDYSHLAHYYKYFQVGLIPYREQEPALSCMPLKLFEYLASGCSVVATNLPEVARYAHTQVVWVGSGVPAFVKNIHQAQQNPHQELCQQIARDNSWQQRLQRALEWIAV